MVVRIDATRDNTRVVGTFETTPENLNADGRELQDSMHTMGRDLTFHPESERFVNEPEDNGLLTREYCKEFDDPCSVG